MDRDEPFIGPDKWPVTMDSRDAQRAYEQSIDRQLRKMTPEKRAQLFASHRAEAKRREDNLMAIGGTRFVSRSGIVWDVANPTPEMMRWEDVAESLAKQCRWNGHCKGFYSVAQHCVMVSLLVPRKYGIYGASARRPRGVHRRHHPPGEGRSRRRLEGGRREDRPRHLRGRRCSPRPRRR